MNTIALTATERFLARKPAARQPVEMLSFLKAALKAGAVIGAFFVVALAAAMLRVFATAHTVPGFHDALVRLLPFLD